MTSAYDAEIERRIFELNDRLEATLVGGIGVGRRQERQRILEELERAYRDQERRRIATTPTTPSTPTTPITPSLPSTLPDIVRPTPRQPVRRDRIEVLGEQRVTSLAERLERFQEAIDATNRHVDECFAASATITETSAALADQRRRRVGVALADARPARARFLADYERASINATVPLPDVDELVASEHDARDRVDEACDFDSIGVRQDAALKAARRCSPDDERLPARVRDFVLGRPPFANYIDRRVYCFTGTEVEDQPGEEDIMALPPRIMATVFPPEGDSIGRFGFEVVVKEGRYIGIAAPDTDEERRRRRERNSRLVKNVARTSVQVVQYVIVAAKNVVARIIQRSTIAAALRRSLRQLVYVISRAQQWIIETVTRLTPERVARTLLSVIVGKGTYVIVRALSLSAMNLLTPALRRPLFLLAAFASIKAYRSSLDSGVDEESLSRRMFRAALVANVFALLTPVAVTTIDVDRSSRTFEQSFALSPTADDAPIGGDGGAALLVQEQPSSLATTPIPWPTWPTGINDVSDMPPQPPPIDEALLERTFSPYSSAFNDFERELFGDKTFDESDVTSLDDAIVLANNIAGNVEQQTWRETFDETFSNVLDVEEVGAALMWSAGLSLIPGMQPIAFASALKGIAVKRIGGRVVGKALQSEIVRNWAAWLTGTTLLPLANTLVDLERVGDAAQTLKGVVDSMSTGQLAEAVMSNAIVSSATTPVTATMVDEWTRVWMRDAVGRLVRID